MQSPDPPAGGVQAPALFRPVDPASLVAFRVAFGLLMGVLVLRYFLHGWIEAQFYEPARFFSWPGFSWVRPWPHPWMHVHFAVLGVLAALITVGLFYRASALLFFLGFTYAHLIDKTNYLNHYYLISLLSGLLVILPLGRAGSLDVKLGLARGLPGFGAWALWLLRLQVGVVYFFAGVAKLQGDWLFRAQPLRLWLSHANDLPVVGPVLGEAWVAYLFSWGGAAFDLAIPFLLLCRRSRAFAFALVVVFHIATAALFPIGLFPWIMIVCAMVFFDPSWPRRLIPRRAGPGAETSAVRSSGALRRGLACALLGGYALVQIALPLRHWLYPGDVLWTEEGFRFSWRVMVNDKTARARFTARDRATGESWEIRVGDYLTPAQTHFMATQPDMIRDFARMMRGELERPGRGRVEVRAEVWAALNGRPARRLVDPTLDLASEEAGTQSSAHVHPRPGDP